MYSIYVYVYISVTILNSGGIERRRNKGKERRSKQGSRKKRRTPGLSFEGIHMRVKMVDAKGSGDASTNISSPKNDNDISALADTFVRSPTEANVDENVVVSERENIIEGLRNEEKALMVVRNEENSTEEEDNGEVAIKEKEEKNGQAEMEEEEEEEDAMEEEEEYINHKTKEKNKEKVDANSNEKVRKPRKRRRTKKITKGTADKVERKDEDKPESSGKKKSSKKVESMGMIFMCSSTTKKDCYRYKVLGLPANKKDVVQKIYKGMRLFLFDCDLRLMYGIYKAAGPGGSNIEPKAFKSAFPSQVRFTVLEDCLPLAEEKFKKVIKDNYFSRNKFDGQLNSEQVKKLCKLFVPASKGSKPQKVSRSLVAERHTLANQGRIRRWGRNEERGSALGRERRHRERSVVYAREVYPSQMAPLPRVQYLPAPAPAPLYAYERTLEMNSYRREPVLEHRGPRLVELEPRHPDETGNRDAYISYREREAPSYREREAPSYREFVYSAGRPEYYPYLPTEYRPMGTEAGYRTAAVPPTEYHSSAGIPAEYRPSVGLLAQYRAAGVPAEHHAPAGLSYEYRSSAGTLRDYHYTTMYRS